MLLASRPLLSLAVALLLASAAAAVQPLGAGAEGGRPLWSGDFETGGLSQWQGVQQAEGDRIRVVDSPTDDGDYAARFEVRKGDVAAAGSGTGNRAEVLARRKKRGSWPDGKGTERYYGWSTLFPDDYPIVDGWQTFVQWKNDGSGSSPLVMQVQDDRLYLQHRTDGGSSTKLYKTSLERGEWQRFVAHVKWSPDGNEGFVELWHNGEKVLDRTEVPTMYRDGRGNAVPNYLKQGLYRSSSINEDQVLFQDEMKVGSSYEEVAP